jgi:predicted metalloprotease with PDZ domain
MRTTTGYGKSTLWLATAIAVIAIAGASGTTVAKEKSKAKAETPGGESGNGYIGVYMQELDDEVRKGLDLKVKNGVLVSGIEDDAPAAAAGLEEGDVIVSFNGKAVSSPDELRDAVRAVEPGKEARVEIVRDGKSRTLTLTVGDRPERGPFSWNSDGDFEPMRLARDFSMFGGPRLGVQTHELEDDGLASYFGAKKGEGVLVLSVDEESVADKAGVKPGDIINRVGEEKVTDTEDVRDALRDYEEGDTFDITVMRHGKTQALKATMDDNAREFAFRAPEAFRWHQTPRTPRAPREPRVWMHDGNRDELRRELDDLRKEIRELKEELEERDDG